MSETIKNGAGDGHLAKVDQYNQLYTRSTMISHIAHHSDIDESAFVLEMAHTQQVGGSTENMGYITYTGDLHIAIMKIALSTEEDSDTNTGLTKFGIWRNPTTLSGGIVKSPVNLNFSSLNDVDIDSYGSNDGASEVTISGGSSIGTVRLSGPTTYKFRYDGSIIMGKSTTLAIKVSAATTGTKTRAHFFFFEHGF